MKYKLKDIGTIITGTTPKTKNKDYYNSKDFLFVGPTDLKIGKYLRESEKYVSLKAYNDYSSRFIGKNSLMIDCIGSDMGNVSLSVDKVLTNQQINSITDINENNFNVEFLYYLFSTMKKYFHQIGTNGSTMPIINKTMFEEIEVEIPNKVIQDKIAYILSKIDMKIDYNIHTNNNLYEIGKALYQEYFENEEYTNNYEIRQLSEVTTNNRNKIDQTKEYKVLSAVNTGNLVLSDDYFDKQVYSKDIGKYLNVNKNDFAYNPARINIGSIGLNTFDFNCCVSPVYVTFSVDKDYIDFFDFYFKSKRFNAEVTLRASGSVRQALNYNDFGMIEIPYPTKEMIEKFNSSYKTIKERININKTKISNLEQLRDTLLPKLMNGEIDLDKIEI